MNREKDFKSITIPFSKSNQDVKEKIKNICGNTGSSKVDIICDAIRQYNPNKDNNIDINRAEIEKIVKEILGGILLNNMSLNINPQVIQEKKKTEEEMEKEKLNELNNKKINLSLLDDD